MATKKNEDVQPEAEVPEAILRRRDAKENATVVDGSEARERVEAEQAEAVKDA